MPTGLADTGPGGIVHDFSTVAVVSKATDTDICLRITDVFSYRITGQHCVAENDTNMAGDRSSSFVNF